MLCMCTLHVLKVIYILVFELMTLNINNICNHQLIAYMYSDLKIYIDGDKY